MREHPLSEAPPCPTLAGMNRHSSLSRRAASRCAALGLALAMLAGTIAAGPAAAADLGPYAAPPEYSALPPSPCALYAQSYEAALRAMRQTAGLFHRQKAEFLRLKRRRNNDGFVGPDITLNSVMTAEQIDVAHWYAEVETSVHHARIDGCTPRVRLNEVENAASRLKQEVAQVTIWVDPITYQ